MLMMGSSIAIDLILGRLSPAPAKVDNWLADKETDNPGQKVTVEAKADAPGWYYIGVLDPEGKSHEDPYAFRVTLEQLLIKA